MRIESVEAIPAGNACYVRVTTDDGTTGVGESTFFGWPTAVAEIVRVLRPATSSGKDPLDVEHHWLALYRALSFRGMAVTGRDQRARPGALGHQGQALRRARLAASRRTRPPRRARDARHRAGHASTRSSSGAARAVTRRRYYGAQDHPLPARPPPHAPGRRAWRISSHASPRSARRSAGRSTSASSSTAT